MPITCRPEKGTEADDEFNVEKKLVYIWANDIQS